MNKWLIHLEGLGVWDKVHLEAGEKQLRELFEHGLVHRCPSRLLGEDLLLVADETPVPAGNDLVAYAEAELGEVANRPPEQVKAIHLVKKFFDGVVEGESDFRTAGRSADRHEGTERDSRRRRI